jgi:hypothetical protein
MAMLGIGERTGLCRAHGPQSLGLPVELAMLAGDSGSVSGVKLATEPEIGLFNDKNDPIESVRLGCGIDDADDGSVDAGRGALVGVGCMVRHKFRVRSITSAASMDAKAVEYWSLLTLDSATIYSANSCSRSRSVLQLLSFRTKV